MLALRPSVRPTGHTSAACISSARSPSRRFPLGLMGALEKLAATVPCVVVRHGYIDVGKRDFSPWRLQLYGHRRACAERSAHQLLVVRPRGAAPAVGAADREH